MNSSIELLIDLFAFSLCGWMLYGLYLSIRIGRFIVKRYEVETDLLNTVYFKEHATFTRNLPNFFSSPMYISHLLTFVWGWNYFRNRKAYRDIKDPEYVIKHFSKQEIRWAKWFAISCSIFALHGVTYYVFSFFWPEVFN